MLVAVIDNTTDATLLSCTVTSTSRGSCSSASRSSSAAPGDKVEVRVTATGFRGNNRQWQVRFRH